MHARVSERLSSWKLPIFMEVTQSISFIISATNYIDFNILDFNATEPYDSLAASFAGCRAVLRENVEGYKASNRIERKSTCYPAIDQVFDAGTREFPGPG